LVLNTIAHPTKEFIMGRVEGKVALITGAARGQGRSHAIRLAEEGADIIAIDIAGPVGNVSGPPATPDDLAITVKEVEAVGRRIVSIQADVRDQGALDAAVATGLEEFGKIDVVSANAGSINYGPLADVVEEQWQTLLDINLTGVLHTIKATIPALVAAGPGSSLILTASVGGLKGAAGTGAYIATKHGVIGLMRTLAIELAPQQVRVNAVAPGNVNTDMLLNDDTMRRFLPDEPNPTREQFAEVASAFHTMEIPWVEPRDISNAVLFLASDEARYITGVALPVDAGALLH
jgi:(-)-trans-carveol dehydrogenase